MPKAMVNVIMDQRAFGGRDGFLHGLQLNGNIDTRFPRFNHARDVAQMPFGTFQPLDEIWLGRV